MPAMMNGPRRHTEISVKSRRGDAQRRSTTLNDADPPDPDADGHHETSTSDQRFSVPFQVDVSHGQMIYERSPNGKETHTPEI